MCSGTIVIFIWLLFPSQPRLEECRPVSIQRRRSSSSMHNYIVIQQESLHPSTQDDDRSLKDENACMSLYKLFSSNGSINICQPFQLIALPSSDNRITRIFDLRYTFRHKIKESNIDGRQVVKCPGGPHYSQGSRSYLMRTMFIMAGSRSMACLAE